MNIYVGFHLSLYASLHLVNISMTFILHSTVGFSGNCLHFIEISEFSLDLQTPKGVGVLAVV